MARSQVAIVTSICGANDDCIVICDVTTGNVLSSYRLNDQKSGSSIGRHCIDRIGYQYVINSYQNSPLLNIWSLEGKDRLYSKLILAGNVGALCVTNDGNYCLVAIETRLYIWQLASGYLMAAIDGHYQAIRVVKMTDDDMHIITGADDGIIMIWNLSKVIVNDSRTSFSVVDGHLSSLNAEKTISNSPTSIVDIHVGRGSNTARFVVCAEQSSTVKMYNVLSGTLIATISFPESILSVLMDRMERCLYAGSSIGTVYQVLLSHINQPTISIDDHYDDKQKQQQQFIGHNEAVHAMAVTIDGQALLTGSQDRTIRLWHIESHQCMRTMQLKGPVSNLIVCPSMAGLFLFDRLDCYNYSLNNVIDNNNRVVDPSLMNGPKRMKSKMNEIYSRPQSIEQTLRTLPNPPKPISSVFERDVFRLRFNPINVINNKSYKAKENSADMLNAFDQGGCIWIRNDQTSGRDFWPNYWSNFNCFNNNTNADRIESELVSLNRGSDDQRMEMSADNHLLVDRLRDANQQLYQYAIDAIFNDELSMPIVMSQRTNG